jgi:predicted DNA-binding WGR domain protein
MEWTVKLELDQGTSSKFWRARLEGSVLFVNFGQIGSTGQTQVRDFGSRAFAVREYEKLVRELRKKGYRDATASGPHAAGVETDHSSVPSQASAGAAATPATSARTGGVVLVRRIGNRNVTTTLHVDGNTVTMESTEIHDSADGAKRAHDRLKKALVSEGYEQR